MKEDCNKRAPDREVRYVAFKSYHAKPPAPSVAAQTTKKAKSVKSSTIDQRVKLSAKKPPCKKLSTSDRSTASKYKGDSAEQVDLQEELGHVRQKVADLQETLANVQAENESLKQSLAASVPSAAHQQVQEELRDAQQKYSDVRVEMETLLEQKRSLQQSVDEMTTKLEHVNRENAELHDQVELSIDKANFFEGKVKQLQDVEAKCTAVQKELQELQNQHQELHNRHHELHSQLQEINARNEELAATNERTAQTLHNLQDVIEEQKLKMEDYANVKRKLKQTELQVQKVIDEKEVSSKFVELMESENMSMKQENGVLVEQNAKLSKDLVDMKKKMEHLRQKFDDVNKENKLLREKETRYLIHERINVGKYSKYPSTIADDARSSYGRPTSSSVFRLPTYSSTNPLRRAKSKNEFDIRLHKLLHRRDSTDRILKTKYRKY